MQFRKEVVFLLFVFIFMSGLTILGNDTPAFAQLYINEFMADNDSMIEDPHEPNNYEDWIEIYNGGDSDVDMGGMYLTDDPNDPTKWQIPVGVTISAGGYLIFWADNDEEQGATHANFQLNKGGEEIGLFGADGLTLVDFITFGTQRTDVSYGRYPDGTDHWGFMAGTPSAANGPHNAPPVIAGTTCAPISPTGGNPVWVTCMVNDDSGVASVTLTYNAGSGEMTIPMLDNGANNDGGSGDGLFGAQIPAFIKDTIVDYYVTATDHLGAKANDPIAAPAKTYSYVVDYMPPPLHINEFMADNDKVIEDPDDPNNFEDWIEIYNSGDSTVDVGGMYLTDNLVNPTMWQIPAGVTIQAGGYLLFWADNDEEQGANHTGFRLNKAGGEIGLYDINAKRNMPIDTMTFGEQPTDISCGRIYDGEDPWVLSKDATPGYTNAFPLGTHPIIWTLSLIPDSYPLMNEMGDCVSAIKRSNTISEKWESAYLFWGKPSGRNFPVEPGESYIISIISPCSFSL